MEFETILMTIADGVAQVTLNRPQTRNALSSRMRAEITAAVVLAAAEAR
ncbi:MAG: 2-(1,2-epoxy-1,2-dihydrophenyl)acetyl-CoA isomerase, partial [Mangrovicoccus sp.]|nr:2-(1,2-epoxy-1,2-dihydrophenyl)acetyl-CoA isomerase [Mangrovicoccus sp.]